jgi:hypothetical protein
MTFSVGDIVRVAKQPEDLLPKIVGEVGFVEGVLNDFVSIKTLWLDGGFGGGGAIPVSCLVPETSPQWVAAKSMYDKEREKHFAEGLAFSARVHAKEQEMADKYGISVEAVLDIVHEIRSLYP